VDDISVEIHGRHEWGDTYVADISLISAVLSSPDAIIEALPRMVVVPELRVLVAGVADIEGDSDQRPVRDILFAGSGHRASGKKDWRAYPDVAKRLLAKIHPGSSDYPAAPEVPGDASPTAAVERIRAATVTLAKQLRVPVIAIGSGFKRSLGSMPALVYKSAVRGLEAIRWRIRDATGGDRRCIWFVFFAQVTGWCIDSHLGIDGTPTGDLAMMMDP